MTFSALNRSVKATCSISLIPVRSGTGDDDHAAVFSVSLLLNRVGIFLEEIIIWKVQRPECQVGVISDECSTVVAPSFVAEELALRVIAAIRAVALILSD